MQNRIQISGLFTLLASLSLYFNLHTDAAGQEVRELEPGVSIERELAGGDEHHYRIALKTGQHAVFQIVKQGANVTLTLKGPSGESLFTANLEALEQGVETLSLIAKNDGPHTLVVEPDFKKASLGRYQVKVDELREASEQDQRRFTAQQAFVEATQLFNKGTAEARQEAIKKLTESLPLWQSIGDRAWEARTLFWLGWTHLLSNKYAPAIEFLNQALELRRAARDTTGEAETLRTIGMVHTFMAQNQKALEYFNQALGLQKGLAERWQVAFTFVELGKLYWRLGEQGKMNECFAEGLRGLREAGDEENEIGTLTTLSFIHVTQGDYQSALDYLQLSLPFFRTTKNLNGEAAALNTLGQVYYNLGDPRQALEYFNQSLSGFRELRRPYNEAYVLINLGITENTLGDKQKSLDRFNEALLLMRAIPNPRGEANLLRHIGQVYQEIGELPKAMESLNQSLRLAREHGEPIVEANALTSIGEVYAAMGEREKAIESLNLALPRRRAVRDRQGEARTLSALAAVERDRGELGKAQTYAEEAIWIIESLRAKVAGAELRTSYLATNQGYYEQYIDLLMRLHEQSPGAGHDALALQASEKARARALLDSLVEARADIRQGGDPALLARERSLQKQLGAREDRRQRLLTSKHTPEQAAAADREVDAALAEYRQVQAQIRASSPRYAALTQPQPLELKEIQAQLGDETLLLVYSLGAKRSFLWAVTPATMKSYVLPSRDEIEKGVRGVKDSPGVYQLLQLSHQRKSKAKAEAATQQLSRLLLGPVARQITRKRLVIVPDGALQYIPFAALTHPGSNRRLIADHEVISLPSVSALGQLRRDLAGRGPAPKTVAVIADPVFEAQDERFKIQTDRAASAPSNQANPLAAVTRSARDAGLQDFPRLSYTRREADQITSLVPPAMQAKILDFDASRATLAQTDLGQYRFLHFATHSLVNSKNPELSGIVLSLYDRERQPQDGFLRAHELYNLKLGADLVVLSACQTALGKEVRGEGLIGLSRGFLYAGAPRLVVSLWKVNDLATAELMNRFYRGMLRENLRPAAALRAAQAEMARKPRWRAPYYWAGFVLQGEWR